MWQKKTKAFTLVELVITLLISAFLFGAAYLSLQLMVSRSRSFSEKAATALEVNSLRHALTHDFNKSRYILLFGEGVTCFGDSAAAAYLFEGSHVIRLLDVSDRVDTFHLSTGEVEARFEQQEVFMPGGLVESLSVDVYTEQDTFRLHMQRTYSAEEKMNLTQAVQE